MNCEGHQGATLRRISLWSLIITLGISILALIGWAIGAILLASIRQQYIPIAPSTALCFALLSSSFLGYFLHPHNSTRQRVATLCALIVLLISIILLIGFLSGTTFEAEHLGFDPGRHVRGIPTGYMAPLTALIFIAAAGGMLLQVIPAIGKGLQKVAAFLATGVTLTGAIVIVGYLYGTPFLYGGSVTPVAIPTAVSFIFIGLGMIAASGPHAWPVRYFLGPSVRSRLMRAFLPVIVVVAFINDVVEMALFPTTNAALLSSLVAILTTIVIGTIISKIAKSLGNQIDTANRERDEKTGALRESEKAARRLAQENELIGEIGRIIGSTLNIDEVYERFAEKVREAIPFDAITINLVNIRDNTRTIQYHSGIHIQGRNIGDVVPLDGSVTERVVRTQSSLLINVKDNDELLSQYPGISLSAEAGIQSRILIPLFSKEEVIGTLLLRSVRPDAYTEKELNLAERVGSQIAGAIANAQLFLKLKRMEEEIREMSLRDQMTELYNRRGFITLVEQQIRAANRARKAMLLIFVDLDGLKGINDTLGHEEGDRALIDAANVLRQTFRESDVIARLGGDEFAVLSIDATDMNPEDYLKRLQENIDAGNAKETKPYKLAMSWGTAFYDPESPMSFDKLMSQADMLMYAHKSTKASKRS